MNSAGWKMRSPMRRNWPDLTDYKRVELPEQKDLFEQIMADLNGQARTMDRHAMARG